VGHVGIAGGRVVDVKAVMVVVWRVNLLCMKVGKRMESKERRGRTKSSVLVNGKVVVVSAVVIVVVDVVVW